MSEKKQVAGIELRVLDDAAQFEQIEELQAVVWSQEEVVPVNMLIAAVHNGGMAIGAYEGERLVGFVFGFVGLQPWQDNLIVKHSSHMLAVDPQQRGRGIGLLLKLAQRRFVQQQGLELVTWTYDPLEGVNAYLNIAKLGGVCNRYRRDVYGDMSDNLNSGLPSDRFEVSWWINSDRVNARFGQTPRRSLRYDDYMAGETQIANTVQFNATGWPVPHKDSMDQIESLATRPPLVMFEIPVNFQGLKAADMALAAQWRDYSRVMFELFFGFDYAVTDFVFSEHDKKRSYYVLTHGKNDKLGLG